MFSPLLLFQFGTFCENKMDPFLHQLPSIGFIAFNFSLLVHFILEFSASNKLVGSGFSCYLMV